VEEVALAKGQFLGGTGFGGVIVERFDYLFVQPATRVSEVFVVGGMSLVVLWFDCFPEDRKNRGSGDSGREPEERADKEREGGKK
jgi:hypothetical protein